MAIYHLHVQTLSRRAGRSAIAAAAYRAACRLVDERTGEIHDFSRKGGVFHREIVAPVGAEAWVFDRERLWNAVERAELRCDSRVARELDVALPRELNLEAMKDLARAFVREAFVSRGMVADVCLHDLAGDNPHMHVLLTTRRLVPGGFGRKDRSWDAWGETATPQGVNVVSWRERWAQFANEALAASRRAERIDHRTLAAQGIHRIPTVHLGRWHSINKSARSPMPRVGLPVRAIPWSATPMPGRDRRSRMHAMIGELNRVGGRPPDLLAPIVARHLAGRIAAATAAQGFDVETLRKRAQWRPPDIEAWLARSRRRRLLEEAARVEAAELQRARDADIARRRFAAPTFLGGAPLRGEPLLAPVTVQATTSAKERLSSWLDTARRRLQRWVARRVAAAFAASEALARLADWERERARCAEVAQRQVSRPDKKRVQSVS